MINDLYNEDEYQCPYCGAVYVESWYTCCGESHLEKIKKEKPIIKEEKRKCSCSMETLMIHGCKCGGE